MHRTLPRAARNQLEEIRDIHHKRVGLRVDGHPHAICIQHLEGWVGSAALADEREPAKVCVCANAHVRLAFLGWVVDGTDVCHGMCRDVVKVGFGEVEGEGEDVQHALAELEHGAVVAVDCGTEEEGGWVCGPLVAWGVDVRRGRRREEGELFGVGKVLAHEKAFFEVWVAVLANGLLQSEGDG